MVMPPEPEITQVVAKKKQSAQNTITTSETEHKRIIERQRKVLFIVTKFNFFIFFFKKS